MPHHLTIRDEAEWLNFRQHYVGGSEVAALFDQWLHDGQVITTHLYEPVPPEAMFIGGLGFVSGHRLWMQKSGLLTADDISGLDRIMAGRHLEAGIAAWAMEKWSDFRLRKVRRYTAHSRVRGWGATVDYETVRSPRVPVELKTVSGLAWRQGEWEVEGDELVSAPLRYLLQVQSQIGAAETSHGWLVACLDGRTLYRMRVERHDAIQARLEDAISAFWAGVDAQVFLADHMDREATAKLTAYTAEGDTVADLTGNERIDRTVRRYQRWKRHLDRVDAHVEKLKGQVVGTMGESTVAVTGQFNLRWPLIVRAARSVPAKDEPERRYRGALYISTPKAKEARND